MARGSAQLRRRGRGILEMPARRYSSTWRAMQPTTPTRSPGTHRARRRRATNRPSGHRRRSRPGRRATCATPIVRGRGRGWRCSSRLRRLGRRRHRPAQRGGVARNITPRPMRSSIVTPSQMKLRGRYSAGCSGFDRSSPFTDRTSIRCAYDHRPRRWPGAMAGATFAQEHVSARTDQDAVLHLLPDDPAWERAELLRPAFSLYARKDRATAPDPLLRPARMFRPGLDDPDLNRFADLVAVRHRSHRLTYGSSAPPEG